MKKINLTTLSNEEYEQLQDYYNKGNFKIIAARLSAKRLLCSTCPYDEGTIKHAIENEKSNRDLSKGTDKAL